MQFLHIRTLCLLMFVSVFISPTCAQNLVRHGGFEDVRITNIDYEECYSYPEWTSLLKFKKTTRIGIPHYANFMSRRENERWIDFWKPDTGNSFFYTQISYLRNLYQTKLIKTLNTNSTYRISFRYKINCHGFQITDVIEKVNDKIGFLFSENGLTDSIHVEYFKNYSIKLDPMYTIRDLNAEKIGSWQTFEQIFTPEKEHNFLAIGNFEKLIEAHEIEYNPIKGITVLINNVTLELLD